MALKRLARDCTAICAMVVFMTTAQPYPVQIVSAPPLPSLWAVPTTYLPFDMPVGKSLRRVFAHYVPNFPISIDNKPPNVDYYSRHYLPPDGEGGVHSAYGGLLRDRPVPRAPIPFADWRKRDLLTEIAQARSVGIDGFALDIILLRRDSDFADVMLSAASMADSFSVMITADLSGPLGDLSPQRFSDEMAPYLSSPAAFHLVDKRPVLSAFYAERRPVEWWTAVVSDLYRRYGLQVAFVPLFLDAAWQLKRYAPVSYGFGVWGARAPASNSTSELAPGNSLDLIQQSRQLGKVWMQPVAFQDARPRDGTFEESENGLTNRLMWDLAIQNGAQWVQLITWNDYAETTAMAPSVAHGWRLLDMNAYDIARFKYGYAPPVVRDALYTSYRIQPWNADPVRAQSLLMTPGPEGGAPRDAVEVVVFAVAPATLRTTIGGRVEVSDVPAGRSVFTLPLAQGPVAVELWRGGTLLTTGRSDVDVTPSPYVQDLQYRVFGGLR